MSYSAAAAYTPRSKTTFANMVYDALGETTHPVTGSTITSSTFNGDFGNSVIFFSAGVTGGGTGTGTIAPLVANATTQGNMLFYTFDVQAGVPADEQYIQLVDGVIAAQARLGAYSAARNLVVQYYLDAASQRYKFVIMNLITAAII